MGLILNISKSTLILYNFIYSITIYILEIMFKIKSDDIVKEYCIQNWIIEYHTFKELQGKKNNIDNFEQRDYTGFDFTKLYANAEVLI